MSELCCWVSANEVQTMTIAVASVWRLVDARRVLQEQSNVDGIEAGRR